MQLLEVERFPPPAMPQVGHQGGHILDRSFDMSGNRQQRGRASHDASGKCSAIVVIRPNLYCSAVLNESTKSAGDRSPVPHRLRSDDNHSGYTTYTRLLVTLCSGPQPPLPTGNLKHIIAGNLL